MGAGGRLGAELPPAGPAPQGLGQPEAAADVTPLPPAGRPAAVPGAAGGGTHEQSRRAGAAAGGDCPQGLPVLQDLAGGPRLRCLYQRDPDPLEEGRTVHRGGSPGRPLLRPKKRECSCLTSQNPCAIQLRCFVERCFYEAIVAVQSNGCGPVGETVCLAVGYHRLGLERPWPGGSEVSV